MNLNAKKIMQIIGAKPVAYNPYFAKLTKGNIAYAVILSQLVYWASVMDWQEFHKKDEELAAEVGTNTKTIQRARAFFARFDFFVAKRKGAPAKMHYIIDPELLLEAFHNVDNSVENHVDNPSQSGQIVQTGLDKMSKQEWTNCPDIYTDNTTDNTTDTYTAAKAASPIKKNVDNLKEKQKKKPNQFDEFLEFWQKTSKATRGVDPIITKADRAQAGRILRRVPLDTMQKLALYYLADWRYRKFAPAIRTFAASGIINALLNDMKNNPEFWKRLNNYIDQYLPKTAEKVEKFSERAKIVQDLQNLAKKFAMPGANDVVEYKQGSVPPQ